MGDHTPTRVVELDDSTTLSPDSLRDASEVEPLREVPTRKIPLDQQEDTPIAEVVVDIDEARDWSGQRLDRYLVLHRIGRGGMGDVLLAYDPELDRRVAIKLMRARARREERDEDAQARLLREAQALARLSHPNVVAVHDVGTAEGRVWVAMEYIEGVTLDRWFAPHPPWREVVAKVRAAGLGLAAAHESGVVHRDFKPGNVMVGEDGRVRVLDFGLAREVGSTVAPSNSGQPWSEPAESLDGDLSSLSGDSRTGMSAPLTQTGLVLGTPAYMSAEQFDGEPVDGRTDQFALCVVLYEGLYGHRPFVGGSTKKLADAVRAGDIRRPEHTRGVPHRIETIVVRGLSPKPADRYPSMEALLSELDRAARPLSVRWASAGAAGLGIGGIVLAWSSTTQPCRGAEERIAETWSDATRAEVTAGLTATELPYAGDTAQRLTAVVDGWTDTWIAERTAACEATQVHGEQSEWMMDLRMRCLDLQRTDLQALVELWSNADAKILENAVQAATRLPDSERCADPAFLTAVVKPPRDERAAEAIRKGREKLAEARALGLAGDWSTSAPIGEDVLAVARELDVPALLADAALQVGTGYDREGRSEEAQKVYVEGLEAAAASNHGATEALLMSALVGNIGYYGGDPDTAEQYATHARGILARLGHPPIPTTQLALQTANMLMRRGDYDGAEALYEEALAIEGRNDARLMQRLAALNNLAALYGMRSEFEKSLEAGRRAVAIMEEDLGPSHPAVGIGLNNIGANLTRLGMTTEAADVLQRSEQVLSAAFPEGHPELAKALHNLGGLLEDEGRYAEAEDRYERALVLKRRAFGDKHPSVALTLNNLGQLQLTLGRVADARKTFEQVEAIFAKTLPPDHLYHAFAKSGLGEVALAEGRTDDATALLRQALEANEKAGSKGLDLAEIRFVLARAIDARSGGDREHAVSMAEQALAEYRSEARPREDRIAEVEAWLATPAGERADFDVREFRRARARR